MTVSRHQIVNELLPALTKIFGDEYAKYSEYQQIKEGIEYHVKARYGKYSIYKWEFVDGKRTSTTLAKGIDRDLAVGMMKLLKEPK